MDMFVFENQICITVVVYLTIICTVAMGILCEENLSMQAKALRILMVLTVPVLGVVVYLMDAGIRYVRPKRTDGWL